MQRLCKLLQMRMLIVVQEAHGSEIRLQTLLNQTPYHYRAVMSAGDSPGAGGVAFLIPWFSEAELAALDPQMLPSLSLDSVIDGR
eukprot:4806252-Pyramimonas_sp.AAC.1